MASMTIYQITHHVLVVFLIFMSCMEIILSSGFESVSEDSSRMMTKGCIEKERKALLEIKRGLVDTFGSLSSWGIKLDCCQWELVGCDNRTGHVTHLRLSGLDFPPFDKFDDDSFSWTPSSRISNISSSLLDLEDLNYLDLSSNDFGGLPIPNFIGSLAKLVYLDLSYTHLGRAIPHELGNLSKLYHLDLAYNFFGWRPIPHDFGTLSKLQHLDLGHSGLSEDGKLGWLFNLTSLVHLDLSGIDIGTATNWVTLIQRLPLMSVLHLNYCNLTTSTVKSSFSNHISSPISTLYLHGNFIDTSIFDWLFNLSGSLVRLDLSSNQIRGKIPESFAHMTLIYTLDLSENQLHGAVPNSFRNLSNLRFVHFYSNSLTGNLQNLLNLFVEDKLRILLIHENQFTGSLPDITRFSSLVRLQVSSNNLNGYLPKQFEQNSVLELLDLSHNSLKGSIPKFTGFSSLERLYLDDNKFSGSLPDFTECSSLKVLSLGENQITKWETQSIGQLTNLFRLNLSMNLISSTISESQLTNLSSLRIMDASYNSLTFSLSSEWLPPFQLLELYLASCNLGPKFPNWIRNQTRLYSLDFSNSQISDTIPMWFGNISSTVDRLNLSSNQIRGKFYPKHITSEIIDLSYNHFEGPIPVILSRCLKIDLSHNKFSGTLLLSAVEDMSLGFLDLSQNSLFGSLPNTWVHFKNLVFLNLGHNNFAGRIPVSMGNLVSLQTLILRKNSLYGELPGSLRNCSKLGFVDFGVNKLSGKIPAWIGEDLLQLYALILRSNKFDGSMPSQLCHLQKLQFLDLSTNRISGIVPQCLGNLTAMIKSGTEITDHYYNYTYGIAPASSYVDNALAGWKGQEFEYGRNFAFLKMIDLSFNQLTGEIPTEIMRLLDVKGLNLSRNKFYGTVPLEIGRLKMLESLDLSRNKFSGKIPPSMSELNFLGYLDLSNNNFSGKIPSGTQLQGFSSSTYEGNLGLCGYPLTKLCPGDAGTDEEHPTYNGNEVDEDEIEYARWLYISAALGFSTTFWGICGSLLLNRRWRHAYFLFLKNFKDRLYLIMVLRIARTRRWY